MATAIATTHIGKVVQVIGPVLDVEFESGHLPELYNALEINATTDSGQEIHVTVEVQQHIGRNQVRAVAMSSTDAVVRGMEVVDTGGPISATLTMTPAIAVTIGMTAARSDRNIRYRTVNARIWKRWSAISWTTRANGRGARFRFRPVASLARFWKSLSVTTVRA